MTKSLRNTQRILQVFLFALFLAGPMSVHLIREIAGLEWKMTQIEFRKPNPRPSFPDSWEDLNNFPQHFESYVNDYFGLRNILISWNSRWRYQFGVSGSPNVLLGQEDWLYFNRSNFIKEYRGLMKLSARELRSWYEKINFLAKELSEKHITFVVTIAPAKHTIYPEYLPDYLWKIDDSPFDQISRRLRKAPYLNFVDLRPSLMEAKDRDRVYHKTDLHWNLKGAFQAYQAIMQPILAHYPDTFHLRSEDVNFQRLVKKGGSHARFLALDDILPEEQWQYVPESSVQVGTFRDIQLPGISSTVRISTKDDKNGLTALVLGDSFMLGAHGIRHFFRDTFAKTILVHRNNVCHYKSLIQTYQPDVVIFELVEWSLRRVLATRCLSP